MAGHHIAQTHLDEVGNGALGLCHAEVHRHRLNTGALALLVLQHHVAHLGTVAVPDDDVIVALQQIVQRLASLFHILYLFLISAFLAATKQGIAAKSHHSKFSHFLYIVSLDNVTLCNAERSKVQIYTFFLIYAYSFLYKYFLRCFFAPAPLPNSWGKVRRLHLRSF